MQQPEQPMEP
jgi:hypothetical protein